MLQLLQSGRVVLAVKAEVAFSVDPRYLKGVEMWGHDPAQSSPAGLSGGSQQAFRLLWAVLHQPAPTINSTNQPGAVQPPPFDVLPAQVVGGVLVWVASL